MEANPKYLALLESLIDATNRGRIRWEETASEDEFRTLINPEIVRIGRHLNREEFENYFLLTLVNSGGKIIEQQAFSNGPDFEAAETLFEMARRDALRVDDFIDRMISAVKSR